MLLHRSGFILVVILAVYGWPLGIALQVYASSVPAALYKFVRARQGLPTVLGHYTLHFYSMYYRLFQG